MIYLMSGIGKFLFFYYALYWNNVLHLFQSAMNTWSVNFARCSAREEFDDRVSITSGDGISDAHLFSPANLKVRNIRRSAFGEQEGNPGNDSKEQKRVTEWVQCERKNCKKWRKLPAHIDMKQLPEKWFCEMNSWDAEHASCDWPEESDSEGEQQPKGDSRNQLIASNAKGPGSLSYRRIIFSSDGRVRASYSEKSKNSYGLFSYTDSQRQASVDEVAEPIRRIGYWWSSSYDESGSQFVSSCRRYTGAFGPKKEAKSDRSEAYYTSEKPIDVRKNHVNYFPEYLNHAARKLAGWVAMPPNHPSKNFHDGVWMDMMVLNREHVECHLVKTILAAASSSSMSMYALLQLIEGARFLNDQEEACRRKIDLGSLKAVIKRLEESNEVEVMYHAKGELTVQIINLDLFRKNSDESKSVPLKLRIKNREREINKAR